MTFALGVFDLFTYGIPGSLQLAVMIYAAVRLNLVSVHAINTLSGPIQFFAAAIMSYLLGHLTYLVSNLVDRVLRFGVRRDASDAWSRVSVAAAEVGARPVPRVNVMLLLAEIELRDREAAAEIARFRATGLMLRNCTVPTLFAMLLAVDEVIAGPHRLLASGLVVLFALAVLGFARHGQQLRHWANTKTYEIAYWLDAPSAASPQEAKEGMVEQPAKQSNESGG